MSIITEGVTWSQLVRIVAGMAVSIILVAYKMGALEQRVTHLEKAEQVRIAITGKGHLTPR